MTAMAVTAGSLPVLAQSPSQANEAAPAGNGPSREVMAQDGIPQGNARPLPHSEESGRVQQVSAVSPENVTAPAANVADPDRVARLEKQLDVQQKQMQVMEKMIDMLGEQVKRPAAPSAAIEELEAKEATLEARSQQAARRDQEVADQIDRLNEQLDAQKRNDPLLPAPLKELFLPSGTLESPLSINGQFLLGYNQFQNQPGVAAVPVFSPYFLLQLQPDWLLAASMDIAGDGTINLGEAQFNWFANDWLTVVGGRFITPIGFFNERLNHEWINRLPDEPLMFRQVSPQITTDGLEIRGAHYLFGSPVKLEYMFYGGNGFQVDPTAPGFDINDLEAISGGPDTFDAGALGGRLGLWIPAWGVTAGASVFYDSHYLIGHSDAMTVCQYDVGYRRGNWDLRFEGAHMFQEAADVLGNNIHRSGCYAQAAYRPYDFTCTWLSKTEVVFRFSEARFLGIDPATVNTAALVDAPLDRNQYTVGINYWFHHAMVVKFAYEINQELGGINLHDNQFLTQFVWAF
jgi:hypothetical protein